MGSQACVWVSQLIRTDSNHASTNGSFLVIIGLKDALTSHISLVLRKKGPCERSLLDKEMELGHPKFLRQNLYECWGSKLRSSAFCGRHYTV